jgi:hypothetical protein
MKPHGADLEGDECHHFDRAIVWPIAPPGLSPISPIPTRNWAASGTKQSAFFGVAQNTSARRVQRFAAASDATSASSSSYELTSV